MVHNHLYGPHLRIVRRDGGHNINPIQDTIPQLNHVGKQFYLIDAAPHEMFLFLCTYNIPASESNLIYTQICNSYENVRSCDIQFHGLSQGIHFRFER